jgi:hypothetical protein
MTDDETIQTDVLVQRLLDQHEPLARILTVLMAEVHNQMPRVKSGDTAPVTFGEARPAASDIDVAAIAQVIAECVPDHGVLAELFTLAALNLMGAVEWTGR